MPQISRKQHLKNLHPNGMDCEYSITSHKETVEFTGRKTDLTETKFLEEQKVMDG
jgi:hypothetical protein